MWISRPSGSVDVQVEAQRRRGRVRHGLRVEDGEAGLERRGGLDAHARSPAKNSAIAPVDALAAGDALPARLDHADEPIGLVGGHDRVPVGRPGAVDDQRLRVGLELEVRVRGPQRVPRGQLQLRLGRAGRARVHGDHRLRDTAAQQERETDRHLERVPQLVGHARTRRAPASARPAAGTRGRRSAPTSMSRTRTRSGARRAAAGAGGPRRCRVGHSSQRARSGRTRQRGRVRARERDPHGPAVAQQRHRLELELRVVHAAPGAREVEAAPAVRARQLPAGQLAVGQAPPQPAQRSW